MSIAQPVPFLLDPFGPSRIPKRARIRTTAALDAETRTTLGGPWSHAVRDAVIDAMASDDWRCEQFSQYKKRARTRQMGTGQTLRGSVCQWIARVHGLAIEPALLAAVIELMPESEVRSRRIELDGERAMQWAIRRWPHLGAFAVDYQRIRAARRRAKLDRIRSEFR